MAAWQGRAGNRSVMRSRQALTKYQSGASQDDDVTTGGGPFAQVETFDIIFFFVKMEEQKKRFADSDRKPFSYFSLASGTWAE